MGTVQLAWIVNQISPSQSKPECTQRTSSGTVTVNDHVSTIVKGSSQFDETGWRPPSPYTRIEKTIGYDVGNDHHWFSEAFKVRVLYYPQYPYWACQDLGYSTTFKPLLLAVPDLPAFPQSLQAEAVNGALIKLKQGNFNLAENIGEGRETIKMIADSLRTISRVIAALRAGNWKRALRLLKLRPRDVSEAYDDLASAWLAMRYGWYPLFMSIWEGIEFLESLRDPPKFRVFVIRNPTQEDIRVKHVYDQKTCYNWIGYDYTATRRTKFRCKVRLDYQLESQAWAAAASLGVLNPAALFWELTRLSFVADWVWPIGKYLEAFDASSGWKFLGGSMTKVTESKISLDSVNSYTLKEDSYLYRFWGHSVSDLLGHSNRTFSMSRTVYGSEPWPVFPFPDFDWFKVKRALDLIALIRQLCR